MTKTDEPKYTMAEAEHLIAVRNCAMTTGHAPAHSLFADDVCIGAMCECGDFKFSTAGPVFTELINTLRDTIPYVEMHTQSCPDPDDRALLVKIKKLVGEEDG